MLNKFVGPMLGDMIQGFINRNIKQFGVIVITVLVFISIPPIAVSMTLGRKMYKIQDLPSILIEEGLVQPEDPDKVLIKEGRVFVSILGVLAICFLLPFVYIKIKAIKG